MLYGGQDKEAKVDAIHNLTVFPNKTAPTNPIVLVDSWHKRAAPKGVGNFAFEVQSKQDREGNWHIIDLVLLPDPDEAQSQEQIEQLRNLIKRNPASGQDALSRLAAGAGISRLQAIKLLKEGTGKHWQVRKIGHNKSSYSLLQK